MGDGYSGRGEGKNNAAMQSSSNIGPIPRGKYQITSPFTHPHAGPYTMRLHPKPGTMTYGRSGFMIHGDSVAHARNASKGCIILAPTLRHRIWHSGDRDLEVVQ
ncbi:tlde1 domain-containing protein [Paraburkholderia ferrariae]|uniref:tlde1 domain-containing protein n=1 Tax=Paraburkholderia ferrariae TaxID=386056 RepID=UPI00247FBC3D|nr:tlde1 domain-containing protein [Paraburkholderia ferrariae]